MASRDLFDVVEELREWGIMATAPKAVTSMSQLGNSMSCVMCDKVFFPNRRDARFCSAKCRKAANRKGISGRGKPSQASYDVARQALFKMASYNAQNSIKSLVISGLELLDDGNKRKIYEMLREYNWED